MLPVPRDLVEDVLIDKYVAALRSNPKWDRKKAKANDWEDDPDNPEMILATREERLKQGPWVVFRASDGRNAMRVASIEEILDVLSEAGFVS